MKKIFMLLLAIIPIFLSGCGNEEVKSIWNDNAIVIDGNQTDWLGKLKYLADEKSAVGIANDCENLYLCLATSDTSKMFQLFITGFTVWFEPQNGRERIGIQYPLRSDEIDGMMSMRNRQGGQRPDFNVRLDEFKSSQTEFRIVNADNFPLTSYSLKNDIGINIDIGYQMGLLVYEMKIPLKSDLAGDHILNLSPGDEFSLGFESGEFNRGSFGKRGEGSGFGMGNTPPDGGMGGRDGGMEGRGEMPPGGGMGRGGQRPGFEKIDFEVSVKLEAGNYY
ncbi:MAG: hypothetical protein Q7S39_06875 [Ignavibacteria bacterium]|nr:hypothetical protein [Ignavibacteria bacterium]